MKVFIIRRHSPDWKTLAEIYQKTGQYCAEDFLPNPIPPGFPTNMSSLITLWNETFSVDFFSCRARLSDISMHSCQAVTDAVTVEMTEMPSVLQSMRESTPSVCFFVDDDDWFSPLLASEIDSTHATGHAVRWSAPLFRGRLIQRSVHANFPRLGLYLQKQASGYPKTIGKISSFMPAHRSNDNLFVGKVNFLFQTNNYGITHNYVNRYHPFEEVIDHVHASKYFMHRPFSLNIKSLPQKILSITNKHPCSATVLSQATRTSDHEKNLYESVQAFVSEGREQLIPEAFSWARPMINDTLNLFEKALAK